MQLFIELNTVELQWAQTLMAHSPGLARNIVMIPTGHFMDSWNYPWLRTIFPCPKPFLAIETLLYICS